MAGTVRGGAGWWGMITALALACASCAPVPPAVPIDVACTATDGDTIRCGDERIRLLGIDSPELAGHCRPGRKCVAGNGDAARDSLAQAMAGRALTIRRTGKDSYGRTLATVAADGADLSCQQLRQFAAVYVKRWDDRGLVRAECSDLAQ